VSKYLERAQKNKGVTNFWKRGGDLPTSYNQKSNKEIMKFDAIISNSSNQ